MIDFNQFEVLTFDCYGTLIDWERGILNALRPCIARHGVTIDDDHLLEVYAEIEAMLETGPYHPYGKILHQVMVRMCERFGFDSRGYEFTTLAESLPYWPPFDDTVAALAALKTKYKLGIISNIDQDLFARTAQQLEVEFDFVTTAGEVGVYKPSPRMFEAALARIDLPKEKVLHVAQSLYHDHVPAKQFGLSTVWINRRLGKPGGGATPTAEVIPDATFADLASLVKATGL